jgi:hypothetical protein
MLALTKIEGGYMPMQNRASCCASLLAAAAMLVSAAPSAASARPTYCRNVEATIAVGAHDVGCRKARSVALGYLDTLRSSRPKVRHVGGYVCRPKSVQAAAGWVATCTRGQRKVYITPQ